MVLIKRLLKRSPLYVLVGYGIASIPLSFIGNASSIYYLLVENIPFLKIFFPSFSYFFIVITIPTLILAGMVGYAYLKKTWLFRTRTEIEQEANNQTVITCFLGMQSTLQIMKALNQKPSEEFMKRYNYWKILYKKIGF